MIAEVKEVGSRPSLWTQGVENAPQAAVQLAKIFEQPGHTWADRADIILDWENSLLESDEEELHYPVMLVVADKYVPGRGHLIVQSRFDINNVFLGDYVSYETLLDIVEEFRIMTIQKLSEAGVL